jgi:hypothetical protein
MNLFFIAFGFEDPLYEDLWAVAQLMEIFFLMEILVHFFTAYRDPESFKIITNLKHIAINYMT